MGNKGKSVRNIWGYDKNGRLMKISTGERTAGTNESSLRLRRVKKVPDAYGTKASSSCQAKCNTLWINSIGER